MTLKPSGKLAFCEHRVPSAHQQCSALGYRQILETYQEGAHLEALNEGVLLVPLDPTLLMDRSTRCLQKADFPEGFSVTQPLSEGNTF